MSTIAIAHPASREMQRHAALKRANEIKLARAALMRRLGALPAKEGCASAADLVADPPEVLCSQTVEALLCRVHRIWRPTVTRLCDAAEVPSDVTLGALVPRQRAALVAALRYRGRVELLEADGR